MPFMPQRTGPPTNSALRALQDIMLLKIQAGQQMKQMEIQHQNRMKQLDQAYKHDKLLAEEKWERESPLRQLKFDIETRKAQEQNYKDQLRAKDRRFQLYKDEQDVLYKQQQARIQALTDRAANQRILNQIKLEKVKNQLQEEPEEQPLKEMIQELHLKGILNEPTKNRAQDIGWIKKEPGNKLQDPGLLQNIFAEDLSNERQKQYYGPFPWGGEQHKKGITVSDNDTASLIVEILMRKDIPADTKNKTVEKIKKDYHEKENYYSDLNSPKRPLYFKQKQQAPVLNPMVTPTLRPQTPGAWRMNNPYF